MRRELVVARGECLQAVRALVGLLASVSADEAAYLRERIDAEEARCAVSELESQPQEGGEEDGERPPSSLASPAPSPLAAPPS